MQETGTTLQPCPFSSYRLPAEQAWRLLIVFACYQVLLSTLLVGLYFSHLGPALLGNQDPRLFEWATATYLIASLAFSPFLKWRWLRFAWQAPLRIGLDLVFLPMLIYSCDGLQSGFGILLAVTVAAAGLLIGGRCALGIAAMASLGVLTVEALGDWLNAFDKTNYSYAGMLGTAYFTIALLAMAMAQQAEKSEALAQKRGIDLANLKQLNEFIVQNLQSGILILDQHLTIRLINDSALRLLKLNQKPMALAELPVPLQSSYHAWQDQADQASVAIGTDDNPLQVRFSQLTTQGEILTMIFLEDHALYHQRVQESKLASLGRLTAGIAHEIRNPLSAISHASQLLGENPALEPQDLRLVEIIQKHTRRVNETIGNVLQLSRRKASRRTKISLNDWLRRFGQEFAEQTPGRNPKLKLILTTENIQGLADPSQLKQILDNLCSNALKYGAAKDKPVELILGRHPENDRPVIEVVDHGPGISPDQLRQVFEPFYTTSSTGTGLGLFIARELAQLNQALLEYQNHPVQGSRFRITLADAEQVTVEL